MAALAVVALCGFALLWFRLHPHMPWRDALPLLRELQPLLQGDWSAENLLRQLQPHYTAHRVLAQRFLLFLDIQQFSGSGHVFYVTAWLSLFSILGLYADGAKHHMAEHVSLLIFSIATAIVLACSPPHLWNFLNPVCAGWLLSTALSVAAFWILLQSPRRPHGRGAAAGRSIVVTQPAGLAPALQILRGSSEPIQLHLAYYSIGPGQLRNQLSCQLPSRES